MARPYRPTYPVLFHSLGLPGKIRCVLRMKILLVVNSAFLVHVKGIDTDCLTEDHSLTADDGESAPYLPIKNNEEIFLLRTAIISSG